MATFSSSRVSLRALSEIERRSPPTRNDLLPRLSLSYVAIHSIRMAPKRVRKKDQVQIARVIASIQKFGVVVPLVVDDNNQIVHGHAVYDAALAL